MRRFLQRLPRTFPTSPRPCPRSYLYSDYPALLRSICTVDIHHAHHIPSQPPPSPASTPKRHRPTRVTDLYNALVYENDSKSLSQQWRKVMAVDGKGEPISDTRSDAFRDRLESARQTSHAEAAIQVLHQMSSEELIPTPRAVIMAVEACIPAEEFTLAEDALQLLQKLPVEHPARSSRLIVSARTLVAVAYTSRDQNEDALRVMGVPDLLSWKKRTLEPVLDGLELGRDTVAWGVLVKALTKMGMAGVAVDVVDVAMKRGVGMTDTLLHLTIDALRMEKRWRDAHWLFENAMAKGMVPREKTVASMLLALSNHDAKKKIDVRTVEDIVGLVEDPSRRFLSTALLVLAGYGALKRAEEVFEEIGKTGVQDEYSFAWMMAAFGKYLDFGWGGEGEHDPVRVYDEINQKADTVWTQYLEAYGTFSGNRKLRNGLVTKYLNAKTRCFRLKEAVDLCEDISNGTFKQFDLWMQHVTSVLSAIELGCDVRLLRRMFGIMEKIGLKHDPKSLAYSLGTYLGDGNLRGGLDLVREEMPRLMTIEAEGWQWTVLLRRLDMLGGGMRDGGMGSVKDLDRFIDMVKRKKAGVVLNINEA